MLTIVFSSISFILKENEVNPTSEIIRSADKPIKIKNIKVFFSFFLYLANPILVVRFFLLGIDHIFH